MENNELVPIHDEAVEHQSEEPPATDLELAMLLMRHIDNPCDVEVAPGRRENIREFYLREAERDMEKMTDPDAKEMLRAKIAEYHR
ncbi:MAG TPA: hypothetical protein PK263_01445 [bacterium]|nr:hypothetical protein [bacterium]